MDAEAAPLAHTGVCAPGERSRGSNRPTVLSLCGGCPAPLGVTNLSRDAITRRLNVRVSDEELEALRRASAELSCSRSQVVRLLIHCLADGGARMGVGTVAFDYETSHGIVRNLRSIGTLYSQSVAALNTIAKVARESPDEVTAEEAPEAQRVVDAEVTYVADSIGCLRKEVARLSDRPAVFLWN